MPSIKVLPDQVANQIAAGEVIERPVAVVKELVENSLDASASQITVSFRNGGKSYIFVEDNGAGMSPDDALLCLERHATSKIRETNDLNKIQSFGFRGEAIPSIASVSRFTMKTRNRDWDHGTEIFINGGKMIFCRECGIPVGTSIEVAHLFNSVPARRKFLKTENTEAAHIIHWCRLLAVSHPAVSFTLREGHRVVFQSPSCTGLEERIREIFGRQRAERLMPIEASDPVAGLHLDGFIGRPGEGRSTRQEMVCFVNHRPVDSRTLNFALIEAYHTFIPKGRYPPAFLFLKIDPAAIDVNVHPAKREIRFREEGIVRRFVIQSLLDKLQSAVSAHTVNLTPPVVPPVHSGSGRLKPAAKKNISSTVPRPESYDPELSPSDSGEKHTPALKQDRERVSPTPLSMGASAHAEKEDSGVRPARSPRLNWTFLGVSHRNYALYETPGGIVVLNQKAALERIFYDEIRHNQSSSVGPGQKLLFPIPLEFDPVSAAVLEDHIEFFKDNGFEMESFGRNFYRMELIPAWLEPSQSEDFIRDLIALIRERGLRPDKPELAHETIARLAAARATELNRKRSSGDLKDLAVRLHACQNPLTDPRGRPTYVEWTHTDLKKRFQL